MLDSRFQQHLCLVISVILPLGLVAKLQLGKNTEKIPCVQYDFETSSIVNKFLDFLLGLLS